MLDSVNKEVIRDKWDRPAWDSRLNLSTGERSVRPKTPWNKLELRHLLESPLPFCETTISLTILFRNKYITKKMGVPILIGTE